MKWGDLGKFHQICFWSHMIRRFKFVCKAKSDFLISDTFHFLFTFHEYQEPCIHHSRRAALGEAISASWQQLTSRPFKIFLNHQISKTAPKPKMSQKKTGTGSRVFFETEFWTLSNTTAEDNHSQSVKRAEITRYIFTWFSWVKEMKAYESLFKRMPNAKH